MQGVSFTRAAIRGPAVAQQSRYWLLRCNLDPHFWKHGRDLPAGLQVDQAIKLRCAVGTLEYPLTSDLGFDIEFARIGAEASYAASLSRLLRDPEILPGASHFDARLFLGTSMITEEPAATRSCLMPRLRNTVVVL